MNEELDKWATIAVAAHFKTDRPWLNYHELLAPTIAALVGAGTDEVVMMNSLTVNLHLDDGELLPSRRRSHEGSPGATRVSF